MSPDLCQIVEMCDDALASRLIEIGGGVHMAHHPEHAPVVAGRMLVVGVHAQRAGRHVDLGQFIVAYGVDDFLHDLPGGAYARPSFWLMIFKGLLLFKKR